jgi:broad specificity phosphatase PhoE
MGVGRLDSSIEGIMRMARNTIVGTVVFAALFSWPVATRVDAQEAVYLVRHAERQDDTTDAPLSPDGAARAARLGRMLRDAGITAVFATQYRRTIDTARPLAEALGLPVTSVTAGQNAELLARVRASAPRARILIVGHSDTVPELLALLGYPVRVEIAKVEYDNLFIVVPGGATPLVLRLRY